MKILSFYANANRTQESRVGTRGVAAVYSFSEHNPIWGLFFLYAQSIMSINCYILGSARAVQQRSITELVWMWSKRADTSGDGT